MQPASLSIWHLIVTADPIVKVVMFVLLCASVWSWTIIIQRLSVVRQAQQAAKKFEKAFWSGIDLTQLYQNLSRRKNSLQGMEKIFHSGFTEFLKSREGMSTETVFISSMERSLRVSLTEETDRLERGLSMLATIGSVAPFVGLFGTVWGIMGSFKALAGVSQATLSMVAPGISEALIATAMGLFVAIPAVVAYNRYTASTDRLLSQYENFEDELTNILQRQHRPQPAQEVDAYETI